ncbi:amidohydrolase family protein [Cytophagaceae bacterium DM2B3-1]|uniref:Amidohydrolase family protein n=1 Tax=Xanthocytophaga flava TaxID=3048013 RepID=A0ABT7CI53_9BACT|nr:amidohydrolase family protein [Xanthocytophaga flavus]MDJ1493221.1 amidohydrolase family protein [Xanthocytophaga flavus]
MKKTLLVLVAAGIFSIRAWAQPTTFPRNGVYDERPQLYAFTNATIHTDYQTVISNATLVIRNGVVESVGAGITVPTGAVVTDLKGKHIYPGLVDIYSDYGMPEVKKEGFSWGAFYLRPPQYDSGKKGAYNWNEAIRPENSAADIFAIDAKKAEELRKLGFGAALIHNPDGIFRGTGAVVHLGTGKENEVLLKSNASTHFSFDKGSSKQIYPVALMGSIALIRQTYLDADWYKKGGNKVERNLSLDAFNQQRALPAFFEANTRLNILRADKIGDEFGIQYIIKTKGDEYARLDEIKATNAPLVVSLDFPKPFDVEDPLDMVMVPYEDMKHWELAPSNPAALAKAGIPFALTAADLKNKADFWANLRKAIEYGLDEKIALKALTVTPATLLKMDNQIGSLKKGMIANFLITSDNLFGKTTVIYDNYVAGNRYTVTGMPDVDIRGEYTLAVGGQNYKMTIAGMPEKPEVKIGVADTGKAVAKAVLNNSLISISFKADKKDKAEIRLTGWLTGNNLKGEGMLTDGKAVKWVATYSGAVKPEAPKENKADTKSAVADLGKVVYPFIAFGVEAKLKAEDMLIKNATVWTNEAEGKLENADVLIKGGKIAQVGKNLSSAGVKVIDGTGKHLTAGIIDEHSHIATESVNELQASTAEVRIGDNVDSEDINIYRQLAGGVTTSQILHGSANPIGGQSALIKLKWGEGPEELKIKNADGFIKFALGENVKQSSSMTSTRFPQTRMGVEQVMMDAFIRAKEYDQALKKYNPKDPNAVPVRRDLELDALAEILNQKRFITCHSYVQSEINMLMHVADSLGFKINTFTHILEGYKVADKMKSRNINASTFADWWAYKMEVQDAIAYSPTLMNKVGLNVGINSDDAEMARRLNQEAAKTVKYGGTTEEDALKMVTLNPARMLHLENRIGSIKAGKDADLVLWNGNPLSIYSRPEKTIIEGTIYYDLERDIKMREELQKDRARIATKMLAAKASNPQGAQMPTPKVMRHYHCDSLFGNEGTCGKAKTFMEVNFSE